MRNTRKLLIVAIVAFSVGTAASWLVGSALSAPSPRKVGPAPSSLNAESVTFLSDSGSAISGWLVPGVSGHGAVVLGHSVRSNRLEMVSRAEFLRTAGTTSLLFDSQAHGESPGEHVTFGSREALDAHAAVAYLRDRFPEERIGYIGVSQGAAAALLGPAPLAVEALVLEAVYSTLQEAVSNRIAIRLGPLAELLSPLLLLQLQLRLGIDPASVAPIEGIRHIRAPLLLIAGDRDRHTLLSQSRRIFEAAPEPKSLWVLPGAAHVSFHQFSPDSYERRVLEFLDRTLRSRGSP